MALNSELVQSESSSYFSLFAVRKGGKTMTARILCIYLHLSLWWCLICTTPTSGNNGLLLSSSVANLLLNTTDNLAEKNPQSSGILNGGEIENFHLSSTGSRKDDASSDQLVTGTCQLIPIVHLLKHPGCQLKAISSFACAGACPSYVQVS